MYLDEDGLQEFADTFSEYSLEDLKNIQRLLTIAINYEIGHDGGKEVFKKEDEMHSIQNECNTCSPVPCMPMAALMQDFVVYNTTCPGVAVKGCKAAAKKKEEETMETESMIQRRYLSQQLNSADYRMTHDLQKSFGLVDDDTPRKGKELVDRITSGKYVLLDETKVRWAESAVDYIKWRDPAVVEDKAGYVKALAAKALAEKDAERTIQIGTPVEGLAALKAFEGTMFH